MKKGYLVTLALCVVMAITSFVSATILIATDTDGFVRGDLLTISSFIIDLVAFIVSLYVFFSIDAVNEVTSMEGNVLEDADYSLAYASETRAFAQCRTQDEFAEVLFGKLEAAKRKTKSCIDYADNLQLVIDKIIWFAYIDVQKCQTQWDSLCEALDAERQKYVKLSSQLRYLLGENMKLIRQVNICQEALKAASEGNADYTRPALDDIRGGMLGNPITRIVYYDYLGLQYMLYAQAIINEHIEGGHRDFSEGYLLAIREANRAGAYAPEVLVDIDVLVSKAIGCFEAANDLSRGNMLWESYISFNLARMYVLHHCVFCGDRGATNYQTEALSAGEVMGLIDATVEARQKLLALYRCTMMDGQKENYLLEKFRDLELPLALELKGSFEAIEASC